MEDPLNGIPPELPPDSETKLLKMNGGASSTNHADTGAHSVSPTMTNRQQSMDSSPSIADDVEMKDDLSAEDTDNESSKASMSPGDSVSKDQDSSDLPASTDVSAIDNRNGKEIEQKEGELVAGSPVIGIHQKPVDSSPSITDSIMGSEIKDDGNDMDWDVEKKENPPSEDSGNEEAEMQDDVPAEDTGADEKMDNLPVENSGAGEEEMQDDVPAENTANAAESSNASMTPRARPKAARQKICQIAGEPASAVFYTLRSVDAAQNSRVAAPAKSDAAESDLEPTDKKQKTSENEKEKKPRKTAARRSTVRSRARKAAEEKPTEAQEGMFRMSARWLSIAWILSALRMEPGNIIPDVETKKRRNEIEKMVKEIEEENSHIVDIDLDTDMPMQENYRGVMDKIEKMVLQSKKDQPRNKRKRRGNSKLTEPFEVNFTGVPFYDFKKVTSLEIVKLAEKAKERGLNLVFGKPDPSCANLIEGDDAVIKEELRFFQNQGMQETPGYVSVARFHLADNSEGTWKKLHKHLMKTSMCVITGLAKVTGFDEKKFSPALLVKWKPDFVHPLMHQLPQPTSSNFNRDDKKGNSKKWTITGSVTEKNFSLKTFVDWLDNGINYAKEVYRKMRESQMTDLEIFREELERFLHENQLPINGQQHNTNANLIGFATNIELETQEFTFAELKTVSSVLLTFKFKISCFQEVEKLPFMLSPNGKGNLLNYAGEIIAGLNSAQLYVKAPGSRTSIHPENSALASFNHNIGPGDCIWYGVPLEHSKKMTQLLKHHNAKSKSVGLYATANWPSEEELIKEGIHLQKFVQKPGDTVYVGAGTYHWVQSNGYTVNVSWNIAQPNFDQLALAAFMNDHYRLNHSHALLPIQTIAWNIAEKKIRHSLKFDQLISVICMRSLARAQTEFDYLAAHGVEPRPAAESRNVVPVERCSKCEVCTHNMFFVYTDTKTFCIECAHKKQPKFIGMTAYYRHKMEHWMEKLDQFNTLWRQEAGEDKAPQEATPQDAAPQDSAPQDTAPFNAAPQDAASQDAALHDAAQTPPDAAPQEAAPHDAAHV
ncbi:hypothetical protein CRE_22397 [Caenorhabditis remanei]|uniref:Uncharacterized protein n=1 Tax=Caenorhabditis remanei TaxID=31234 RepID=E3MDX5_CAERE|nr:hypothetical protein CRE_22397 [Caenorhabditis remanei]